MSPEVLNTQNKRAPSIPLLRASADEEDAALVAAAQSGNGHAFEVLVERHQSRIRAVAWRFARVAEDTEDIAQQTFQKAFLHLKQFEGNSSFSTWLYRITANHCLDVLRKRNRRKNVSLESLVEQEGSQIQKLFATPCLADTRLENHQLADKILSTLSEDQRQILTLREAEGLEYQEIADVLGCSLDAVKGRLARSRKQLQENLRHIQKSWDVHNTDTKKEKGL